MLYQKIISIEHLFQSWDEFKKGKRVKLDVQRFEVNLENNLFKLHQELENKTYKHSSYTAFNIYDPKFRHIHKALVKDRIIHHAIVSIIEPIFDKSFIYDSYSCRENKGTHRAVRKLEYFIRKVSRNYSGKCFVLKLDIKKFFASVDQKILLDLISQKVEDQDLLWLIENILSSFSKGIGIPIGNLTSQIFANIYLNELDQFIKHKLKIKFYLRYCDDFVILEKKRETLEDLIPEIEKFLKESLKLALHEQKIIISKSNQGIDFLGYIVLPHYILPRTKTKRRIFRKLSARNLQSYLGYLKHASAYKVMQKIVLEKSINW